MKILAKKSGTILKISVFSIWILLFISLLKRDVFVDTVDMGELQALKQAEAEEYQSIYFKSSKIGYVINKYSSTQGNDILLEQEAQMNLNIGDTVHTIELQLNATLSGNNHLKNFTFTFSSPFYQMKASGEVHGNTVDYTLHTGSNTIKDTMTFETPPLLSTSRRAYLLSTGIEPGEKRKIPWFDPVSMTGKQSIVEYKGKEAVLINNRVHKLHRFTEVFTGARVNSWLNDEGIVIKEESPAGFVFIREPKFKALALADTSAEILSAVAIQTDVRMPDSSTNFIRYRVQLPEESEFDLNRDRQYFKNKILTITKETLPQATSSQCSAPTESLEATPYVQSDHTDIINQASEITNSNSPPLNQVQQIATWVFTHLEKRAVLGLPDALTTLKNKIGDCNEHAALFAALARAAKIPTRIVAGVTYHRDAFYYHAWNEVCMSDNWISLDTTTNQFPADLTHIKFIQGTIKEQVRIGALLGNLSIDMAPEINAGVDKTQHQTESNQ